MESGDSKQPTKIWKQQPSKWQGLRAGNWGFAETSTSQTGLITYLLLACLVLSSSLNFMFCESRDQLSVFTHIFSSCFSISLQICPNLALLKILCSLLSLTMHESELQLQFSNFINIKRPLVIRWIPYAVSFKWGLPAGWGRRWTAGSGALGQDPDGGRPPQRSAHRAFRPGPGHAPVLTTKLLFFLQCSYWLEDWIHLGKAGKIATMYTLQGSFSWAMVTHWLWFWVWKPARAWTLVKESWLTIHPFFISFD